MAGSPEAILYGHLCADLVPNTQRKEPGSPAWYISKTLDSFGIQSAVVSPYGSDYPLEWLAPGIILIPDKPTTTHTLLYQNTYGTDGTRKQSVSHDQDATPIPPGEVQPKIFDDAKAIVVCPILGNIPVEHLRELRAGMPRAHMTLLPQGYYREITDLGRVEKQEWQNANAIIPLFDTVILSELDGPPGINDQARRWSKNFETRIIVTRASQGSTYFHDGTATNILSFPIDKEVHPTGAGDVFAAAYVYTALQGEQNVMKSIVFASAAAAIHVSGETVTIPKVHELLANTKR